MVSDSPKKAPWDRRLLEGMARESWEAANGPTGRPPNPKMRELIRSRYFWLQPPAAAGVLVAIYVVKTGSGYALAGALYIVAFIAGQLARREALASRLPGTPTKEKS